eukprot:Gb_13325 [translate_table: standard]
MHSLDLKGMKLSQFLNSVRLQPLKLLVKGVHEIEKDKCEYTLDEEEEGALREEKEKLQVELQRSRTNMDIDQCDMLVMINRLNWMGVIFVNGTTQVVLREESCQNTYLMLQVFVPPGCPCIYLGNVWHPLQDLTLRKADIGIISSEKAGCQAPFLAGCFPLDQIFQVFSDFLFWKG